eukprot:4632122-Pleurochrysis_carterae.AAC.1
MCLHARARVRRQCRLSGGERRLSFTRRTGFARSGGEKRENPEETPNKAPGCTEVAPRGAASGTSGIASSLSAAQIADAAAGESSLGASAT